MAPHPDPEPAAPALHDGFERLLTVARSSRRHADFVRRAGLEASLSRGESFLLAEIVARGPIRPSELARSTGLDRSIASRQVDGLERAGLVRREPDPTDGRAALLEATGRGRSVVDRLRAERERWLEGIVSSLDPDDVAELARLLPLLVAAIEEEAEAARIGPERMDPDGR